MSNTFDQPDLELMLRGQPAELQPIRLQLHVPPPRQIRPDQLTRAVRMFRRSVRWLAAATLIGMAAAILIDSFRPRLETAHASLEVKPPSSAETVARRIAARRLIDSPATLLNIMSLPEYTSGDNVRALRRTLRWTGSSEDEDLLRAFEANVRITPNGQGRVLDMEFRASDPSKAKAYLDLLTTDIIRDHDLTRQDDLRLVRESHAESIASARTNLTAAEQRLMASARAAGLVIGSKTAAAVDRRFSDVERSINGARASLASDSVAATEASRLAAALESARSRIVSMRGGQAAVVESDRQAFFAARATLEEVLQRMHNAELEVGKTGSIRPLAPARLESPRFRPGTLAIALIGALAGLLVGIPICLAKATVDRAIRQPSDIPESLGVPALGSVRHLAPSRTTYRRFAGAKIVTAESSGGSAGVNLPGAGAPAFGESFRGVLASIWIAGQNTKRARVLVFSSAAGNEGKTTVVANLGVALANTRRRVVIVDANLRRPKMHTLFSAPSHRGLAKLLEEDEPVENYAFDDIVYKTGVPGLYVLPAGHGALAVAGMRHIDRLTDLLLRFRLEFHAVLIDTPSGITYPDARIVARLADAAVLVVRANKSSRDRAATLARQFETDGVTVLGCVLNDVK